MNISSAAKALGGKIVGRNSLVCPGPGHSARDRSLSVTFTGEDFAVFSHAGDDWRACKDHVRARLGLDTSIEGTIPIVTSAAMDEAARSERALDLWEATLPLKGTPAETYLTSRGVSYDGDALRWHPFCPFGKARVGCMVALVRNIVTDAPQAVHRTAIDPGGRKLSQLGSNGRLSLGPVGGGAVKLAEDAEVTTVLAIGEGIETALSIRELPDLEHMPVWSVLSAGGIAGFPVLAGIETVWIAADNDASGTGDKASRQAAARLEAEGVEAITLSLDTVGSDLNDEVARHA